MEKQKAPVFILIIVAIIVAMALYKQFDFENLKFQKPALAVVYGITFVVAVSVLIKNVVRK